MKLGSVARLDTFLLEHLAQLGQSTVVDLADPLFGSADPLAHLDEGLRSIATEAKTKPDNSPLVRSQALDEQESMPDAVVVAHDCAWVHGSLVHEDVLERAMLALAGQFVK